MKQTRLLFALAAMSACLTSSVYADDLRDRQTAACTDDAMRLCSSAIPDEGKITACMMARKAELNAGCRAFFVPASTGNTPAPRAKAGHQAASVR